MAIDSDLPADAYYWHAVDHFSGAYRVDCQGLVDRGADPSVAVPRGFAV